MVAKDIMVVMSMIIIVVMLVMFIMVIRTARKTKTNGQTGQTDQTFKLDFPGNLCRAAFAILAMFFTLKIIFCLYLWSSSEPSWVILPPNKLFLLRDDKSAHSLSK